MFFRKTRRMKYRKRPGFRRRSWTCCAPPKTRWSAATTAGVFWKRRLTRWRRQGFPRSFFTAGLGAAGARHGTANIPLDDYTAFLYNWCAALPGIDKACLRDAMVRDRLATNSTGRLPQCLHVTDACLGRAVKRLAQNPATAPLPGVRRGVALLYGARQVVFVDYTQKNPVTGRYLLHTRSIDNLFTE